MYTESEKYQIDMGESFKDFSWIQDFEADFLWKPQNAELGRWYSLIYFQSTQGHLTI